MVLAIIFVFLALMSFADFLRLNWDWAVNDLPEADDVVGDADVDVDARPGLGAGAGHGSKPCGIFQGRKAVGLPGSHFCTTLGLLQEIGI